MSLCCDESESDKIVPLGKKQGNYHKKEDPLQKIPSKCKVEGEQQYSRREELTRRITDELRRNEQIDANLYNNRLLANFKAGRELAHDTRSDLMSILWAKMDSDGKVYIRGTFLDQIRTARRAERSLVGVFVPLEGLTVNVYVIYIIIYYTV